ncbi:TIGR04222 domain-containing membrane protein [Streptomyces sp. NPDC050504]|uniref:TIGR04222 domain-containing membrane protein n=1 Tax=Streptomyces sp. NPDC050504 TaxID=3365618 RepID=UPI003794974A
MFWVLFLLIACVASALACARLCLAAVDAARTGTARGTVERELNLYETAFLAGGPHRVAELTLVSMHRRRRLLLAHTGWATVVDPEGGDDHERAVIGAIGPTGQAPTAATRTATAAADAVRSLADRLVAAGLAVPSASRTGVAAGVRAVRAAAVLTAALGTVSLLMPHERPVLPAVIVAWFSLPLLLSLGCLVIARIEIYPYTRWASPDGQRLLASLRAERGSLAAVAMRGASGVDDPELRAALTHRGR